MSGAAAPATVPLSIHASAVVVGENAILLRGASGAGKSTLALALIQAARAKGLFARLVADDRVLLRAAAGRLIVAPHPAIAGQIERRFVGLTTVPCEAEAVARLVVDLKPTGAPELARLPEEAAGQVTVAGVALRRVVLPQNHAGAVEAILHAVAESSV